MKGCKSKNCKHYKKDERIGIKCCEFDLFHESYCEKDKEDFAIDVLEKLKTELNRKSATMIGIDKDIQVLEVNEVTEILNNHIAELKEIVDRIEEPVKKALSELKGDAE